MRLAPHYLDLGEFERLIEEARSADLAEAAELRKRALALWRGPPLADVAFEGPSRHDAGRLAELHLSTQIERIESELKLGRHTQNIGELEALVAAHPYRERLQALLMLALYRSGRQADALDAYRAVRARLRDELGLEPGQELRDLEATILRQDPSLALDLPDVQRSVEPDAKVVEEVRPVTALLADILGIAALNDRLPLDEATALVGECVAQMTNAVAEYGGSVHAAEAPEIVAQFGLPHAREDDPERAVRTGLRILEVVGDYARDVAETWHVPDFAVRVAINTGRVEEGREDASTLVDELRSTAPPRAITVGAETERRLSHRFDFERQGLTGFRLIGPRTARREPSLRPLIGRDHEIERISAVVADLANGRGRALLFVGEPGVGKTRLLTELRAQLPNGVTWLEGHCPSYGGSPLSPFVEVLRRWLGVESGDAEIVRRTRVRARLGPLFRADEQHNVAALGRLIGVDVGADESADADTRRSYVSWIEAMTSENPVVLAIEDMHWADAATRQLTEDLLGLTDQAAILLVATLRRDVGSEGWRFRTRMLADFSHRGSELVLEPLSPDETRRLLATLLPGAFDEPTREEIVACSEGNPLYLEEVLRALIAGGGLEQRHRTWTTTLRPSQLLPPALENLLVARIDRLDDDARRLAQIAAVIGREFPVSVLSLAADGDTREALRSLLRAEIVREVRRYPELVCAFRHGLLQEAALSTLTHSRRRELYGRVASAFEQLYADSLDDHRERLAHYNAQSA
jgi:class 3 adenylate cyclase